MHFVGTVQSDEMMHNELEIMKQLKNNKHVCSLLACCTLGQLHYVD